MILQDSWDSSGLSTVMTCDRKLLLLLLSCDSIDRLASAISWLLSITHTHAHTHTKRKQLQLISFQSEFWLRHATKAVVISSPNRRHHALDTHTYTHPLSHTHTFTQQMPQQTCCDAWHWSVSLCLLHPPPTCNLQYYTTVFLTSTSRRAINIFIYLGFIYCSPFWLHQPVDVAEASSAIVD